MAYFTSPFGDIQSKIWRNDAKDISSQNVLYYFILLRRKLKGLHNFLDTQLTLTVEN